MGKAIKPVNPAVEEILNQRAVNSAKKYFHSSINSAHVFLGTFSFLSNNKDSTEYGPTYLKFKDLMNSYGINGKKFEEALLQIFVQGMPAAGAFNITASEEYKTIGNQLILRSRVEGRTMEIGDLIVSLFEDKSYNLYSILRTMLSSTEETDELYDKVIKAFKKNDLKREIKEFEKSKELTNLNKWVQEHPQRLVGGEDSMLSLEMCLLPKINKNAILTGQAGVGKSQLVYSFVQNINEGNVPDELKDKVVYELNTGALVAGTRFRGEMEERLVNILEVCKKNPNVLLFIDEIHGFIRAGTNSDEGNGPGTILKPYITKGEVQLIGATTAEEYIKYILPDKAFADRFHEIKIKEPSIEETVEILRGLKLEFEDHFKKTISDEVLKEIVIMSNQYSIDRANPRKSINMMDLGFAHTKAFNNDSPEVTMDDVREAVRLKYKVYMSDSRLEDCRKELFSYLLGQDAALMQVYKDLSIVDANLCEPDRPKFSMLFAGPTGTGKTAAAKIIAEKYFGDETALVKLNMSEYSTEQDVTKLSGSAPGFVGFEEQTPLIKGIREHPASVVLFDEVEKAHPSIWKVLLSILDTGEMQDNKGNKVSFKNCVIIFTTNLGFTNDSGKAKGLGLIQSKQTATEHDDVMKAIEKYFSPEFLGRLDDIVMFERLSNDIADKLIDRYVKDFNENAKLKIVLQPEDYEAIREESKIEIAGARDLKKAVRKQMAKIRLNQQIESQDLETKTETLF